VVWKKADGRVLGLNRLKRETDQFVQGVVKVRPALNYDASLFVIRWIARVYLNCRKLITYKIWWLSGLGRDFKMQDSNNYYLLISHCISLQAFWRVGNSAEHVMKWISSCFCTHVLTYLLHAADSFLRI
jgi:hypothetical protein